LQICKPSSQICKRICKFANPVCKFANLVCKFANQIAALAFLLLLLLLLLPLLLPLHHASLSSSFSASPATLPSSFLSLLPLLHYTHLLHNHHHSFPCAWLWQSLTFHDVWCYHCAPEAGEPPCAACAMTCPLSYDATQPPPPQAKQCAPA
jgi:hypothetical protein